MRKEGKEMSGRILTVIGVVEIISVALHMIKSAINQTLKNLKSHSTPCPRIILNAMIRY